MSTANTIVFTPNGPSQKYEQVTTVAAKPAEKGSNRRKMNSAQTLLLVLQTSLLTAGIFAMTLAVLITNAPKLPTVIANPPTGESYYASNMLIITWIFLLGVGLFVVYFCGSKNKESIGWPVSMAVYTLTYGILTVIVGLASMQSAAATTATAAPPPPAPPGQGYSSTVKFQVTVAGTVGAFDQAAYKSSLAGLLPGIGSEDISLTVTAGSVVVDTSITSMNLTAADDALSTLTTYNSNATALGAALGLTVESVTAPTLTSGLVSQPPSMPSPPGTPPAPMHPPPGIPPPAPSMPPPKPPAPPAPPAAPPMTPSPSSTANSTATSTVSSTDNSTVSSTTNSTATSTATSTANSTATSTATSAANATETANATNTSTP